LLQELIGTTLSREIARRFGAAFDNRNASFAKLAFHVLDI